MSPLRRPTWVPSYDQVGHEFFATAPVSEMLRQSLPISAAGAFRCLEDADAWPVWLEPVDLVTWTTSPPFGVGTTRDIHIRAGTISETFYDWDDGHRMSFHFSHGAIPGLRAFAEDYELVPTGDDTCELVWRYAFEFGGVGRLIQPLFAFGFGRAARRSVRNLAAFLTENTERYA